MQQYNTVGVFTIDDLFSQHQIEEWRQMIHDSPDDVKKFNNNGNFKNGKIVDQWVKVPIKFGLKSR